MVSSPVLSAPTCRLCGERLTETFVDLGMSPLCESFLRRRPARRDASVLPAARPGLRRAACWSSCPPTSRRRRSSPTTPTSRRTPTRWVAHAEALRRRDDRAARARTATAWSSRWRATTATCCSTSSRGASRSLGVEPAANVAEVGRRARASRPRSRSSASETGAGRWRPTGTADLVVGNNVFAHVPDLDDFAAGLRALVADDGVVTLEFPHLLRLIEGSQYDTIYHEHFSYFSLLTAPRALGHRRTCGRRRRGAAHPRRLAAGPRPAASAAAEPSRRGRAACSAARQAAGLRHRRRATRASPTRCSTIKRDLLELPDRRRASGASGRRLRRPGQGQHAAQPLRHPLGPARRTRSTATRTSTGSSCPGTHIPIHAPGAARRDRSPDLRA